MSYGYAISYLFVTFKNKKDCKKFETMFNESEHTKEFQLTSRASEPKRVFFDFTSDEASIHLDDYIVNLDKWIFENFKIHLEGYWLIESSSVYRCEIHHGNIFDVGCDWLYHNCTVEQIEKLKKIAEELDK